MKIVVRPIYEREQEPSINGDQDYFKRQSFSENLTSLFRNTDEGMVVSIDSQWGDGKTTFIKKWVAELNAAHDFIPIYFDAYKSDFTNDAFLSIAAAIHQALIGSGAWGKHKENEQINSLKDSVVKVTKDSIRIAGGLAISALTAGVMSGEKIAKILDDVLEDTLTVSAQQKLDAHLEAQGNIDYYKQQLQSIMAGELHKKIVFFVDELDRCRPDFAMQVVEKIKHLFDVPNVVFVLAINKRQMVSIISHSYGVGSVDAEIYLQKFIHVETRLPPLASSSMGKGGIGVYLRSVLISHEIDYQILGAKHDAFLSLIGSSYLNLNPRSIERVVTLAAIALTMKVDEADPDFYFAVFIAAAMRIGDPKCFFNALSSGSLNSISSMSGTDRGEGAKYYSFFKSHVSGEHSSSNIFKIPSIAAACSLIEMFN